MTFNMGGFFTDDSWTPSTIIQQDPTLPVSASLKKVESAKTSNQTDTKGESLSSLIQDALSPYKKANIEEINQRTSFTVTAGYDDQGNPNFKDANGELIPGIYTDIPNDVYHSLPAISSSMIKKFLISPAHYYRAYVDPVNRHRTSKALERTFDAGTYAHELILEPQGFYDHYYRELSQAENPELLSTLEELKSLCKDNNLKVSGTKQVLIDRLLEADPTFGNRIFDVVKKQNDEKNAGKKGIDPVVWDDAHRSCHAVRKNEWADKLLSDGIAELSVIARCPETGRMLKVRFDWLSYNGVPVDVKTSRTVNPQKFIYQFADLKYDVQAYMYSFVGRLAGIPIPRCTFPFVSVEYNEADICEVFEMSDEDFRIAGTNYHRAINELVDCIENDDWYGYTRGTASTIITLPKRGRV
ncbi:PD-(D/E)XK nuclease-like domain-containing protein [Photobacterium damselae]